MIETDLTNLSSEKEWRDLGLSYEDTQILLLQISSWSLKEYTLDINETNLSVIAKSLEHNESLNSLLELLRALKIEMIILSEICFYIY